MSDYLSDEEQAERLKQWWDDNGTSLIVGPVSYTPLTLPTNIGG